MWRGLTSDWSVIVVYERNNLSHALDRKFWSNSKKRRRILKNNHHKLFTDHSAASAPPAGCLSNQKKKKGLKYKFTSKWESSNGLRTVIWTQPVHTTCLLIDLRIFHSRNYIQQLDLIFYNNYNIFISQCYLLYNALLKGFSHDGTLPPQRRLQPQHIHSGRHHVHVPNLGSKLVVLLDTRTLKCK